MQCFVNGHYIAAIVIGYSFIERSLAGRFYTNDNDFPERTNSKDLLEGALKRQWITESEHKDMEKLNAIRNAVIHFRKLPDNFEKPIESYAPLIRSTLLAKELPRMLEADAKNSLSLAAALLNKTSL